MTTKKEPKKRDWAVVSGRVPQSLRISIIKKIDGIGELSDLVHKLLEKYDQGKVFVHLDPID